MELRLEEDGLAWIETVEMIDNYKNKFLSSFRMNLHICTTSSTTYKLYSIYMWRVFVVIVP